MKNKPTLKTGFKGEKINVIPRRLLTDYSKRELTKNLYLTDIGYFPKALHHFRKRPQGCPEYILIYCIEGKGTIKINQSSFQLTPNSFYIIESKQNHAYFSDEKNPWSIFWVHFTGVNAKEIFQRFRKQNNNQPIIIPFEKNRIAEFEYMIDLFKNGISEEIFEYSSMLLHKTLGSFIYYSIKSNKKVQSSNEDLVNEIIDYLNQHIYDTVTIEEISRTFNKSSSTIFSLFKKKTGQSLIHFFNLLKVQKACELFNLTNMSVKEISYELNFQDPLYFSRLFKKYMGVSPSTYKNEL
ncbi:AraC family transcriptional regulator [Echinicola jeungdonensis]|uniref:Helix-turn-helix domain-containing protein n=1 Tax=Echinicola jeungdonensis TaxID=709343 RepID=A0ABV5JB98_9BACT|nr:AraC family transcriptional regulator [Echinicola jeungdonensis]MDN3670304.1 AraC family transcriptional regulator [Echinicola jeungdonensis]MDN3670321.1 AraC family transcriptional regulator [Echinicola jeungdonensis]MDN3670350.1 AraC family transcriptional regulator [Echinicola jeungdonensis]